MKWTKITDNNIPLRLLNFVDKNRNEECTTNFFLQNYCNIYACPIDLLGLFSGCKFPI
jgi:hypothetical protein